MKRIAAAGHEIACHGFSHQLIYTQSEAVFREETRRSKQFLDMRSIRCSIAAVTWWVK